MQNILLKLRYYLEIIALPVFAYLVFHLSGHGVAVLTGMHEAEIISGVLLLILFTSLWHQPVLKKWVPCSHDHCHSELPIPHFIATLALCLHFFPEAGIRHELLRGMLEGEVTSILGYVGFAAHLIIDVIVMIVISSHWKNKYMRGLSLLFILSAWLLAFFLAEQAGHAGHAHGEAGLEGWLFLVSAFLLAMFVHKPHKPKACGSGEH